MGSTEPIKLYWSSSKPNVGDWLSPRIVRAHTSREVVHAPARRCEFMAIGSILHKAKNLPFSPRLTVWGSGYMHDGPPVKLKHRVHAVRGRLTAGRLKNHRDLPCGDPGLLAARVFPHCATAPVPGRVGVVPHYADRDAAAVQRFVERVPGALVIDILDDVEAFLGKLTSCSFVLSSSLHGLILADSFHIPNQWIKLSDRVEGKDFKFHDYYSVFDLPPPEYADLEQVGQADIERLQRDYRRPGLKAACDALAGAFPQDYR
ncbi:MAG: polysaccharide pyruvyl transferase family protein [Halioglobus sp.]|nr:polysaccharide pyruvyl transferase family protein [Halioglobus sp.]